jgi:hypothetical protein
MSLDNGSSTSVARHSFVFSARCAKLVFRSEPPTGCLALSGQGLLAGLYSESIVAILPCSLIQAQLPQLAFKRRNPIQKDLDVQTGYQLTDMLLRGGAIVVALLIKTRTVGASRALAATSSFLTPAMALVSNVIRQARG